LLVVESYTCKDNTEYTHQAFRISRPEERSKAARSGHQKYGYSTVDRRKPAAHFCRSRNQVPKLPASALFLVKPLSDHIVTHTSPIRARESGEQREPTNKKTGHPHEEGVSQGRRVGEHTRGSQEIRIQFVTCKPIRLLKILCERTAPRARWCPTLFRPLVSRSRDCRKSVASHCSRLSFSARESSPADKIS
jgi:hypothetical protein